MSTPNAEIIQAAIEGLQTRKQHIDARIAELRGMLNGSKSEPASADGPKGRRTMSAAARKRIAESAVTKPRDGAPGRWEVRRPANWFAAFADVHHAEIQIKKFWYRSIRRHRATQIAELVVPAVRGLRVKHA